MPWPSGAVSLQAVPSVLIVRGRLVYTQGQVQPKYLINSAGDQFFLPDSSRFYFEALLRLADSVPSATR